MTKVFIDGSAGTAGLRIRSRLEGRADLDVTVLEGEARKDTEKRREMLNSCDLAVLCLPDAASRESVAMIENPAVRVVDTSTAHRVAPGWAYGFPELSAARREAIVTGKRVASPGCHAGGFIVLVQPLIEAGILPADALLTCHSLTGYSGGGKGMIAEYEAAGARPALRSPREYGLAQTTSTCPRWRAYRAGELPGVLPHRGRLLQRHAGHGAALRRAAQRGLHARGRRELLRSQVHRAGGQVRGGDGRGGLHRLEHPRRARTPWRSRPAATTSA